ncbi:MAG: hypothetical protein MUO34_02605 [Ignavibacteriaceae bacterium]|nr:hypothetical protein [Ignavibacteriaceae bacterium]
MKVSGFTFIKNAVKYDFPFIESVNSILPICDEFIIVHGDSDDDTSRIIESIGSPKIKVYNTVWNPELRKGGIILSQQTNIALSKTTGDWCFYIQGDEVVHEKYIDKIKKAMFENLENINVEGLLFNYLHFYGSYNYIATSRQWYRREIRVVRNKIGVRSFKDAQGFRIHDRKLRVKFIDAYIYHYGWARPPQVMQTKVKYFHSLWHSKDWIEKNVPNKVEFDFSTTETIQAFTGTHPKVMENRIKNQVSDFKLDSQIIKKGFKRNLLDLIEKLTGYRIGEYKNYKIVK